MYATFTAPAPLLADVLAGGEPEVFAMVLIGLVALVLFAGGLIKLIRLIGTALVLVVLALILVGAVNVAPGIVEMLDSNSMTFV